MLAKNCKIDFKILNNSLNINIDKQLSSKINFDDSVFNTLPPDNKEHLIEYIKKCRLIRIYDKYILNNHHKRQALQHYYSTAYYDSNHEDMLKNYGLNVYGSFFNFDEVSYILDEEDITIPPRVQLLRGTNNDYVTRINKNNELVHRIGNDYKNYDFPSNAIFTQPNYKPREFDLFTINLLLQESIINNNNTRYRDIDNLILLGGYYPKIKPLTFLNRNITELVIPFFVTEIGANAFRGNNLTTLIIPSTVKTIRGSAFKQNKLSSLIIEEGTSIIGDNSFDGNSLETVIIPNSVQIIGTKAFSNNKLKNVIIPNSVKTIGQEAFTHYKRTNGTYHGGLVKIDNVTIPRKFEKIINSIFKIKPKTIIYTNDEDEDEDEDEDDNEGPIF